MSQRIHRITGYTGGGFYELASDMDINRPMCFLGCAGLLCFVWMEAVMDNRQNSWQDVQLAKLSQPITSKDNYWGAAMVWIAAVAALYWMVCIIGGFKG